jgi:hypothetical protein
MARDHRLLRLAMAASGLVFVVLAFGFAASRPWAVALWPWPDAYGHGPGQLSLLFVASICAAIAAPTFWIAWSGELAAAKAGGVNLGLSFGAIAVYLLLEHAEQGSDRLLIGAVVCGWISVASLLLAWWASSQPVRDTRATPALVMVAFGVFSVMLLVLGSLLVSKTPNILPWLVSPQASVVYGWIFLGASVYFAMGLLDARWPHASAPLLGFLAYDLVLLVPFVAHFGEVLGEHRNSLMVYTTVLVLSGALAVAYLFINADTRLRLPSARRLPNPASFRGDVFSRSARR